tara:strand:- start:203 stop:877 length:675 start_codon:yes stop_codon:yes gene_type:complete
VRFTRSPLQNNAYKKRKMAIIYSYPTSVPQLSDKVLGSNMVDSAGAPITGNPTVQFNFSDIKALVAQNFVQQLYSFSAITIPISNLSTGASIKFSAVDQGTSTDSVYYTALSNTFTFASKGTYYIQLEYNTSVPGGTSPKFAFITKDSAGAQVGPTTLSRITRSATTDTSIISIDFMLNITTANSAYQFWGAQDSGTSGSLIVSAVTPGWTDVPSAGITISKLI